MNIYWEFLPGAEAYDLEWLFVSAYADPSAISNPDFSKATRITTTQQQHTLNLVYDDGYMFYRVRGIGRAGTDFSINMPGDWSDTNPQAAISNSTLNSRNWQYAAMYAEDGKTKEVVSFFDGSLRTRQTVTKANTADAAIVSETMYDYEGRPGVSTLPAPDATRDHELKFYEAFSINHATTGLFDRKAFDSDAFTNTSCVQTPPNSMATSEGAGRYYSSNNSSVAEGYNGFIPDAGISPWNEEAGNYPFLQTFYGIDGRVKKQSGAGGNHTIGSTHETEYFYATPLQQQLDRLFGNEVGYAEHYSMTAQVDPNGQVSVSYIDLAGNVIATALAGAAPSSVDALADAGTTTTVYADFNNQNDYVESENAYIVSSRFLVTNPGTNYVFDYYMSPEQYQSLCSSTGHNCDYDLTLTVYDDCHTALKSDTYTILGSLWFTNPLPNPLPYHQQFTISFPKVGTYTIEKKLTISESAIATALEEFKEASAGCCSTLVQIQTAFTNALDVSECVECTTGCSELPTDDYCNGVFFEQLVEDMSKGGQYFDNREAADDYNSSFVPNNNWIGYTGQSNPSIILPNAWGDCDLQAWQVANFRDANGNQIMTWQDLRDNWDPSFTTKAFDGTANPLSSMCSGNLVTVGSGTVMGKTSLVEFHPEYCAYSWCNEMSSLGTSNDLSSDVFDMNLFESDLYSWATANPSAGAYITFPTNGDPVGINLLDADPFFIANTTTGVTAGDKTTMKNYMIDADAATAGNQSLWSVAGTYVSPGCTSTCNDEQWQIFRGLYLAEKREVIEAKKAAYKTTNSCRTVCDASTPPDNISELCSISGEPPFDGFYIRDPDNYGYLDPNDTDLDTDITGAYSTSCNTAASATYELTTRLTCTSFHVEASGGPLSSALDISGTVNSSSTSTPAVQIQQIVSAINSYVSSPVDFTAIVDPQDPETIKIYAPASLGASGNSIIITIPTCTTFVCTTANGVTDTECAGDPNCFCAQLQVLNTTYNAVNPNTSQYYINHTTYATFKNYAKEMLNATYGTSVTEANVEAWMASCSTSVNTDAELAVSPHSATTVPTALQCDQLPPCGEDAADIAGFYAQWEYEQLLQSVIDDFLYNYKQKCFKTVANGGLFAEDFRVQYSEKEYQYTLYYYDQARNLVRTVPPEAVVPLVEVPGTGPYELTAVKDHRENSSNPATYPDHHPSFTSTSHMVTIYKYTSLNQVRYEKSPDKDEVNYWYDAIGRLRFSQNKKQDNVSCTSGCTGYDGRYSYTRYDGQGRVIEVGESGAPYSSTAFTNGVNISTFPSSDRSYVTYTKYDDYLNATVNGLFTGGQSNLRSRVATVSFEVTGDSDANTYDNATHYSYDIHGNVDSLVQDFTELEDLGQRYKYITYTYDLVSGNVNTVHYQAGKVDQLHHRYYYDADNRITNVYTSRDSIVWDQDAKYFYYLHGPMARTEIGNEKVQGMDYAYTINGWIKGVNSNTLVRSRDLGEDGVTNCSYMLSKPGIHSNIASDAFGYSLEYFANDYRAIYNPVNSEFTYDIASVSSAPASLYNGNIRQMATALLQPNGSSLPTALPVMDARYRYDQLQRLIRMDAYTNTTNSFVAGVNTNSRFKNEYTYDRNGNIQTLKRYGEGGYTNPMDDLSYTYDTQKKNKLTDVNEGSAITACAYMDDIDADLIVGAVYDYDEIGNLVEDKKEYITDIVWTPYGKIAEVIKDKTYKTDCNSAEIVLQDLEFEYDAMGNRICKIVKPHKTNAQGLGLANEDKWTYTYYVRDAQGNVMATYTRTFRNPSGTNYEEEYNLIEQNMYGSARLGLIKRDEPVAEASFTSTGFEGSSSPDWGEFSNKNSYTATSYAFAPAGMYERTMGEKMYEASNHLGNVLVTFSDRKLPVQGSPSTVVDYYMPDVLSASDYYPFGSPMPGRTVSGNSYRYGFQGQETEQELWGGQASFFKYRISDNRLGRFFSVDPLAADYPHNSPYAFSENRVIDAIELEGLEKVPVNEVWDIKNENTTVSLKTADVDFSTFQVGKIHGNTVTLHPIISGPNKGNYLAGMYSSTETSKTFDAGFVVGGERVAKKFNVGDIGAVATGGYLSQWLSESDKPLEASSALNAVHSANINNYGYYDETTGNFVATHTMLDGMKEIWTDPLNYVPSPANVKLKPGNKNWNVFLRQTKGQYTKANYLNLSTKEINKIRSSDYLNWQFEKVEVATPTPNSQPNESEKKQE
jgi:hypothetical protein